MTSKAALFALLALWGVGFGSLPARAEDAAGTDDVAGVSESADADAGDGLTNRVWVRTAPADPAGTIRIFLSDGTLVQDSCWETHRLSSWTRSNASELEWKEDGVRIKARIAALTAERLTLVLALKGGAVTEDYAAADVPSVCPDLPKA